MIVISLVRSNRANRIGFLKITNRVNVLLTRAKHGMYIFGNSKCLVSARGKPGQPNPWPGIIDLFTKRNQIGAFLPLCCAVHPQTNADVSEPAHFRERVPEGGCSALCGGKLECGHACRLRCHPTDTQHKTRARCPEMCILPAHRCATKTHLCRSLCRDECPPCPVPTQVKFPCGHENTVRVQVTVANFPCNVLP